VRDAVVTIDASGLEHRVALSGFVGSGGCYQRRVTEDAQGRRVEERCLDPVGRATPDTNGCERRRLDRDARNHVVATKCLHDDGTPATYANEHYEARVTVDELGQETAYDYLDVDGHPKPTGCARMVRDFLPNGLIHAQRCTDGSGAFDTAMRFSYDENGCRSEVWNVDAQGQPIERNGSAGALWTLNEKCSAVVHRTVDARGNPTGMHPIQRYQLDAQGYATRMECFVRDGVATPCRGLPTYQYVASVQRFSYDEHRRVTLTECFDPLGHPAPCGDHRPAVEAYEYGADGQLRVERSLDARRQPALGHGVSYDEIARDFAGRVASRKSFGLLGEPVVSDLGCHEIRWVRDDHHRLVEVECFGINERPSASSMCIDEVCWPVGTARVQVVRISESKRENVFYDVDGKELRRDSCDKSRCYW
jgi:uncharacterized protein YjhX (UPF0386 family)